MRIYLDLDSRFILSSPTRPLSILEFKRRDNDLLELQFVRSGAVVEVSSNTSVRYGLKVSDQYDSAFLSTGSFAKSGTGPAAVYTAAFSLNTQPIADAFDAEPKSISAMLEIEYTDGTIVSSSITLPVTLNNDVIRGNEASPEAIPDGKATQAEAEAGVNHAHWMTPLRTAQAIAALGGGGVSSWNDLTDRPTLGTAASTASTDYATAAQGAKADSALQSGTAISNISGLQTALDGKQAAGSYATLVGGLVPASQLPSYVDDVIESANFASLPNPGESGKIYVAAGKIYRWSGSAMVEISPSPGSTDAVTEGTNNLYFTAARAVSALASTLSSYATQTALDGKAASSHTHGSITNTGAIGTTSGVPIITGTSGVLQAGAFGSAAGQFCQGNDARLSDARTPTSHTHDDRYYTETEMTTLLAGKQDSGSYVTNGGSVATIMRVTAMPATPAANTLYIVIP